MEEVDAKDSMLYLSSDDHWIHAFDSASGEVKWKYGTADVGGSKCGFNSDGTVVYRGTDDKLNHSWRSALSTITLFGSF